MKGGSKKQPKYQSCSTLFWITIHPQMHVSRIVHSEDKLQVIPKSPASLIVRRKSQFPQVLTDNSLEGAQDMF